MTTTRIAAAAVLAFAALGNAMAADSTVFLGPYQEYVSAPAAASTSNLSRAEVAAQAVSNTAALNLSAEDSFTAPVANAASSVSRQEIKAQAVQANKASFAKAVLESQVG